MMHCPHCDAAQENLSVVTPVGEASRGDIPQALMPCICGSCGTLNLLFFLAPSAGGPGPVLVAPTAAQLAALAGDPEYPTLIALQQLVMGRLATRSGEE